ncbi:MAG: hypothetical protein C4343_03730, partial [Chloroflexota bacterium]
MTHVFAASAAGRAEVEGLGDGEAADGEGESAAEPEGLDVGSPVPGPQAPGPPWPIGRAGLDYLPRPFS